MSTSQVALLASVQQFLDRQHGLYIDGNQQAAQSEKRLGPGHRPGDCHYGRC